MSNSAKIFPLAAISAFLLAGVAEARPDLRQMTCAQARQMVQRQGAVVFTTGPHTYSRFVAHIGYCDPWQELAPQYGPTRDNPQCPVAYECREPLFRPEPWD